MPGVVHGATSDRVLGSCGAGVHAGDGRGRQQGHGQAHQNCGYPVDSAAESHRGEV